MVDRELALAEDLGFNAIRLFLCDIVWQEDPKGFMDRLEKTMQLADKHGLRILMTFFTNGGTIKNPCLGPRILAWCLYNEPENTKVFALPPVTRLEPQLRNGWLVGATCCAITGTGA